MSPKVSGDTFHGRVVGLVTEHRETVLAMEQVLAEQAEQRRAYVARLEKCIGDLDYAMSRSGQLDWQRVRDARVILADHKRGA